MPVKPTPEYLKECFDYDPETGSLTWKARPRHHFEKERNWKSWLVRFKGKTTGSLSPLGYLITAVNNKTYSVHRVVWAMAKGWWPADDIDHINGDRKDNRLVNLREATRAQNCLNRMKSSRNTSGVKGVAWEQRRSKWRARVFHQGREFHVGEYDCKDAAVRAVREVRNTLHGSFAHHGSFPEPPEPAPSLLELEAELADQEPPPPSPTPVSDGDDFEV